MRSKKPYTDYELALLGLLLIPAKQTLVAEKWHKKHPVEEGWLVAQDIRRMMIDAGAIHNDTVFSRLKIAEKKISATKEILRKKGLIEVEKAYTYVTRYKKDGHNKLIPQEVKKRGPWPIMRIIRPESPDEFRKVYEALLYGNLMDVFESSQYAKTYGAEMRKKLDDQFKEVILGKWVQKNTTPLKLSPLMGSFLKGPDEFKNNFSYVTNMMQKPGVQPLAEDILGLLSSWEAVTESIADGSAPKKQDLQNLSQSIDKITKRRTR